MLYHLNRADGIKALAGNAQVVCIAYGDPIFKARVLACCKMHRIGGDICPPHLSTAKPHKVMSTMARAAPNVEKPPPR
jgi:hypothetical protein